MTRKVGRPPDLERIRYLDQNKENILADAARFGKLETLKKWGMTDSRWKMMKKSWNGIANFQGTRLGNNQDGFHANGHNGHSGNGHGCAESFGAGPAAITLQRDISRARMPHDRLAELLKKMADAEGSTELARGLRLAATLVETA